MGNVRPSFHPDDTGPVSSRCCGAKTRGKLDCEKEAKNCLLRLFRPLPLAEADTWTAAVLVDEFDARRLKGLSQYGKSCVTRLRSIALK
jgi:hypothetical protein